MDRDNRVMETWGGGSGWAIRDQLEKKRGICNTGTFNFKDFKKYINKNKKTKIILSTPS